MFSRLKDTAVSRDLVNADTLSQQISLIEDVLKGCKWKWTLFLRLHTASLLFLFLMLPLEFCLFPRLVLACVPKYIWSRVSLPQGDFKFCALKIKYLIMK